MFFWAALLSLLSGCITFREAILGLGPYLLSSHELTLGRPYQGCRGHGQRKETTGSIKEEGAGHGQGSRPSGQSKKFTGSQNSQRAAVNPDRYGSVWPYSCTIARYCLSGISRSDLDSLYFSGQEREDLISLEKALD